jgi:hypothetical protein
MSRSMVRRGGILFGVLLSLLIVAPGHAVAGPPEPAPAAGPQVLAKPAIPSWQRGAATTTRKATADGKRCATAGGSRTICVEPAPVLATKATPRHTADALVEMPLWCADSDGEPVSAARTAACRVRGLLLTTTITTNGVPRLTGELNMNVFDYTYGAVDLPNWGHQIGVAPNTGWGDALRASVSGTSSATGDCTASGAAIFPVQSLAPNNGVMRQGESYAATTAVAPGAIGYCTTTWSLTFTTPGYPPAGSTSSMSEMSCDNAIGANGFRPARVGCVIPWFPAAKTYFRSTHPTLADHVARAQASGLPGATFANPLNRNVDQTTIDQNRNLACGDAPSLSGRSCDEYPLASTYQGMAFGGTRRTFTGCDINAPTGVTGPTGVSACMITASENNSQGGLMAAFYYDERVLGTDPYRILVAP